MPMAFALTAGQRRETAAFERLMEEGAVRRPGRGRPKMRPIALVATRRTAASRSAATCCAGEA